VNLKYKRKKMILSQQNLVQKIFFRNLIPTNVPVQII
jgi:hypothetical protein